LDIARHVLLDIELFSIFRGRVQFNDFACIVFILLCVYFIVTLKPWLTQFVNWNNCLHFGTICRQEHADMISGGGKTKQCETELWISCTNKWIRKG
jgi:hypothetical protein